MVQELEQAEEPVAADGKVCEVVSLGIPSSFHCDQHAPGVSSSQKKISMEFGKHIGKAVWAFADKALPAIYGVGFIWLVIRKLPPAEYGAYVLVQLFFIVLFTLGQSFALQPLLKYAAEGRNTNTYLTISSILYLLFCFVTSGALWICKDIASGILNTPELGKLMIYVPALLAASAFRNIVIVLLQANFRIRELFVIDAAYFLGALVLLGVASHFDLMRTANDALDINVLAFLVSSLLAMIPSWSLLKFSVAEIRNTLKDMREFATFSLSNSAGYMVSAQLDTLLISMYWGPIQVASYNAAKVFYRAIEIVAQVIQMFLIPAASRLSAQKRINDLKALFEKTTLFSHVLLFVMACGLIAFAPFLFHFFYHDKYDEAIKILQILALASLGVPWLAACASVMTGAGEVRLLFRNVVALFGISLVCYLVLIPISNIEGAAWGFAVSQIASAFMFARTLHSSGLVEVSSLKIMSRFTDIWIFIKKNLKFGPNS